MNYISRKCIKVVQPFGSFFIVKMKASELLTLTFVDTFRLEEGKLKGNQRELNDQRKKEIKKYIESVDCGFPNSIILAANYDERGFICDDDELRWSFNKVSPENNIYDLNIPQNAPLSAIIDGQHRISGFRDVDLERFDMELVCSIYEELPSSLQAFLFATINSTQKSVSRSLAYQLFGYELLDEEFSSWSPDKLAISFYKKLNSDSNSPFVNHIKSIDTDTKKKEWKVSVAAIVDSILRLISSNPKNDKYLLHKVKIKKRYRSILDYDNSPLRALYLNCRDDVLYEIIINYFKSAMEKIPSWGDSGSAINKTIGIQGLFDALKYYINRLFSDGLSLKEIDFSEEYFKSFFEKVSSINFKNDFFLKFSGVGKNRVRNVILLKNSLYTFEELKIKKDEDLREYEKVLK